MGLGASGKMRRKKAFQRGRIVSIIVAGGIGYLLGGWQATTLRSSDLSPAQSVALRFPEDEDALDGAMSAAASATILSHRASSVLGDPQIALLNPQPMVPAKPQASQQHPAELPPADAAQPAQAASEKPPAVLPTAPTASTPQRPAPVVTQAAANPTAEPARPAPAPNAPHRRSERPGYLFNDAQIAAIKARLHLTPEQEAMWPAVEAALRNVAYARARDARRHGTQLAAADPNSIEVQGLKSAAIPLIMSFSPEQKNEVRNLAHVMGLDRLASGF